jgi:hypothetical protein
LERARWMDSVVIDAMLHLFLCAWPAKALVYVQSAENDVSLAELRDTPSCFKVVIVPLFHKSHWTYLHIDHCLKEIVYHNSQLVDRMTPELQTRPFRELFPGYQVRTQTPPQQTDNSSCGVYVTFWSHCCFFYSPVEAESVTQDQIYAYRESIVINLLLNFLLLRHAHQPR